MIWYHISLYHTISPSNTHQIHIKYTSNTHQIHISNQATHLARTLLPQFGQGVSCQKNTIFCVGTKCGSWSLKSEESPPLEMRPWPWLHTEPSYWNILKYWIKSGSARAGLVPNNLWRYLKQVWPTVWSVPIEKKSCNPCRLKDRKSWDKYEFS